ncbi:MAG: hypothetical protein ACREPM_14385 [Gemmatimonadaceae bacterium]
MLFNAALLIAALVSPQSSTDTVPSTRRQIDETLAADTAGAFSVPAVVTDTLRRRRHAIAYSEWYSRRLTVHRIGSYTMLPMFGAEYVLGQQLLNGADRHSAIGAGHALVAGGIGVLFTVNTVTGLWNLWDSRSDPAGRTRRTIHSLAMLSSDAGFLWAGAIAGQAKRSTDAARRHRNVALGSISVSTLGTVMMWLWKD